MSEASTAAAPEPTEVRFSMRAMLIATIPLAILAALVGPFVRSLDPAQQSRLAIVWGVWLAVICARVGYYARARFRAERMAGPKRAELPPVIKYLPGAPIATVAWLGVGHIVAGLIFAVSFTLMAPYFPARRGWIDFQWIVQLPVSAFLVASGVILIWWRQMVQLRKRGVLQGAKLILWEHVIKLDEWDRDQSGRLVLGRRFNRVVAFVPPEQRAAVDAILREMALVKNNA